jgi:hypothetical protein
MSKISQREISEIFRAASLLHSRSRRRLLCDLAWRLRAELDEELAREKAKNVRK